MENKDKLKNVITCIVLGISFEALHTVFEEKCHLFFNYAF